MSFKVILEEVPDSDNLRGLFPFPKFELLLQVVFGECEVLVTRYRSELLRGVCCHSKITVNETGHSYYFPCNSIFNLGFLSLYPTSPHAQDISKVE